jgi:hypothetical protein
MRAIEDALNKLTDADSAWVGLRDLRPVRDEDMTDSLVGRIVLHYAPIAPLVIMGLDLMGQRASSWDQVAAAIVASMATVFVVYRWTFAWAWNVRARRLRRSGALRISTR